MKNHASGHRKAGPGYRTPSTFRGNVARNTMSKMAGKVWKLTNKASASPVPPKRQV
jgi:hypothetical protein